jgi:hypothetical protein
MFISIVLVLSRWMVELEMHAVGAVELMRGGVGLGRVACPTQGSADRFQGGPPGRDTWCALCILRTRGVLGSRCPSGHPSDTYT